MHVRRDIRNIKIYISPILLLCINLVTNLSADEENKDWPCIQRYVPDMSLAVVWPSLNAENIQHIRHSDENLRQLRQASVDLSLSQKKLDVLINDYLVATQATDRKDYSEALYLYLFEHIQLNRHKALEGIMRYARRQSQMSQSIEDRRKQIEEIEIKLRKSNSQEVNAQNDGLNDDFKKSLQQLEKDQMWETRLFLEREKKLNVLCELPVLLEQRVFFIAKLLNKQVAG